MNRFGIIRSEALEGHHFTVAALIKPDIRAQRDMILIQEPGSLLTVKIQGVLGMLSFSSYNTGTYTCGVVADGKRHHFAIVMDGYDLIFYLDGRRMYTFDAPGGLVKTTGNPVIGQGVNEELPYYGEMSDIILENRTYSGEEIAALVPAPEPEAPDTGKVPAAPLYIDPLFNSAKDGTVVWDPVGKKWWFIYMQIRNGCDAPDVAIHHGTTIGAASSPDGLHWQYEGFVQGLDERNGTNTYWAPEIIWHEGKFHCFLAVVHGAPWHWYGDRTLWHYEAEDLLHWRPVGPVDVGGSCRVLDCCVYPLPTGKKWGIWFKDEVVNHTGFSEGDTLDKFELVDYIDTSVLPLEGADIFFWKGKYWLTGDDCYSYNGLRIYRSEDCRNWERRANILDKPGSRRDDGHVGHHPEVVINPETDEAYLFYWVQGTKMAPYSGTQICYLQAARLQYRDGEIFCDRDEVFELEL